VLIYFEFRTCIFLSWWLFFGSPQPLQAEHNEVGNGSALLNLSFFTIHDYLIA
jgi:hypothetical protein